MSSAPTSVVSEVRRSGTGVLGVLLVLRFLDGLEGQAFALLGPDIQDSLGLSDTALGAITGASTAAFVLAAVPLGHLSDRRNRVVIGTVCAGITAGFALLTGLAGNAAALVLARMGSGVGKAATLPVHNALLADAYPLGVRTRVLALQSFAGPLASVIGPLAIGVAVGAEGRWRVAFVGVSVALGITTVAFTRLRDPERGAQERALLPIVEPGLTVVAPVSEQVLPIAYHLAVQRLGRIRTLRFLLLGVGVLGYVLVAAPTFLSVLLEDVYDLDVLARGGVLAITEVGALAGVVIGGVVGERLLQRRPPLAVLMLAGGTGAYGLVFSLTVQARPLALLVAGVTLANAVLYTATVPIYSFVAAVVPPRLRSLGFALLGMYIFLLGGFLGGIITGLLSDARGPRFALAITTAPVCIVAALLAGYGARFVEDDMALVARDLADDAREAERLREQADDAPVLMVRNIDVSYGNVQILFGVDLDVRAGEIVALVGTNGAGKSTLLRAISGLVAADRGEVLHRGRSITYAAPVDRVAMGIVQMSGGKAVFPTMTVFENLLATCHRFAWDRAEVQRRVRSVLELFPVLDALASTPAGRLSGGEQQQLGLARALLLEPEVLLIDELSLGLSPVAVDAILDVVRRLRDRGLAIVVVEQSIDVALDIGDRAVFLERGQVRFSGAAGDLADRDDLLRAVFLGAGAGG